MKKLIFIYAAVAFMTATNAHAAASGKVRPVVNMDDNAFDNLNPSAMSPQTTYYSQRALNSQGKDIAHPRLNFQDWQKQYVDEASLLNLYPGFKEIQVMDQMTGDMVDEKLVVFEARSKTLINKAPSNIPLTNVIKLDFINSLDATVKNTVIDSSQAMTAIADHSHISNFAGCNAKVPRREGNLSHFTNPQRPWCGDKSRSICVESCYAYHMGVQTAIIGYNMQIDDADQKKDLNQATQTELSYFLNPTEIGTTEATLKKLTRINSPIVGGFVQTLFYANQIVTSTKTISILQADPTNPNQTVMTTIMVFVTKVRTWNLGAGNVGRALQGIFALNTNNCSLTDGIPHYFQCTTSRVADQL